MNASSFSLQTARSEALRAQDLGVEGPQVKERDFFGEGDIYLVALLVIYEQPGCDTTRLRDQVKCKLALSSSDHYPLEGRSDCRIDQIIRNLVSHRTLERYGYAEHADGQWFITRKGRQVLSMIGWI